MKTQFTVAGLIWSLSPSLWLGYHLKCYFDFVGKKSPELKGSTLGVLPASFTCHYSVMELSLSLCYASWLLSIGRKAPASFYCLHVFDVSPNQVRSGIGLKNS